MRIGIIRLDKIGDLILTTPALVNLKKIYPESSITAYVSSRNQKVLQGSPYVNQIHVWNWSLDFIQKVRREKFDIVVVFSPTTESYLAAFLSGARVRAGYIYTSRILTRFFSLFMLNKRLMCQVDQKDLEQNPRTVPHEVEQNLALVEKVSGDKTTEKELFIFVPQSEKNWAENQLPGKGWLCVHFSKAWIEGLPDGFLAALIQTLAERKKIFLTCGPDEAFWISKIILPDSVKKFENLSFQQWAALISRADLCLSTNTGAVHLAASQKTPVLAIFESQFFNYHKQRWCPWKVPYAILRKDDIDLMNRILNEVQVLNHAKENISSNMQL